MYRVLAKRSLDDKHEDLILECSEDNITHIITTTIKEDIEIGDYISVYLTVDKIANSNAGHQYPEGTIGT